MGDRTVNRLVILGVAASDAHVVANQLIAMHLRHHGFRVVNLGACTPLAEFADAWAAHPDAVAVIIGSLNGHARQDLDGLARLRAAGRIGCPVIVGGNLSVGSHKDPQLRQRILDLGVDHVLDDVTELVPLLDMLGADARAVEVRGG
jgi:methylaspartate mutase sigma subunit